MQCRFRTWPLKTDGMAPWRASLTQHSYESGDTWFGIRVSALRIMFPRYLSLSEMHARSVEPVIIGVERCLCSNWNQKRNAHHVNRSA